MEKARKQVDFFVSYAAEDTQWAEWIGWVLEEEGYSVVLQEWDFGPGSNFVLEMDKAVSPSTALALEQLPCNSRGGSSSRLSDCGLDPHSVRE